MPVLYDGRKFCSDGCGCGCPVVEISEQNGGVSIFHSDDLKKGRLEFMNWEQFQEFLNGSKCFTIESFDKTIIGTYGYRGATGEVKMTLGEFEKLRSEMIGKNPKDIASGAVSIR